MSNIILLHPWFLLLIPLASWLFWRQYQSRLKEQLQLSYSDISKFEAHKSLKERLLIIPPILAWMALTTLIIGLARPQAVEDMEEVNAEGIDIVIAMDISSSMLARDFKPDRLTAAKLVATEFIDKRPYDRIGMVVFAGESFTQCPVTTDHLMLKEYVDQLEVGFLTDGTAIGMGVATAVNRMKDNPTKSKVIILMTDGENNAGYIDPRTAAEVAEEFGVKLYAIGIGSNGKALGPINRSLSGEYIFGPVDVVIDEKLLTEMAEQTGGRYFRALDRASLLNIYDEIDRLEKSEVEVTVYKKYRELFRWFISAGLILLVLYVVLKNLILKVTP